MLPLVILPLLLLGGFSWFSSVNHAKAQAQAQISHQLLQDRQQIQSYYRTIEATQVLLSKSAQLAAWLNQTDEHQKALLTAELENVFSQYASSYRDYYEIRLLSVEGSEMVRFSTDTSPNVRTDERQTDYFRQIQAMRDEQQMQLFTNPDNDEVALLAVKKIYHKVAEQDLVPPLAGYLLFTVRPSAIIDVVNNNSAATGVTFVSDTRGIVLFAAQSYLQGTAMSASLFSQLKATVDTAEMVEVIDDGQPMIYQGERLNNDYLLFTGIAREEVYADREYLGMASMVTTLVVMFMVPFLLYYFLKTLVLQPIAELTMAKQAVGKGNLDVRLDDQQQDEIGVLYASFNSMVRQLKRYRHRESENKVHLEDKIAGRTKALKDANRELEVSNQALEDARHTAEQANALKSTFLANMSHEIRTPLTAILGFTEQALKSKVDPMERQDYLQRVLRSGQHLLHLINDILDLSKIEADKLELEHKPINLFELLEDVEALNQNRIREKSLQFVIRHEFPLPQVFNGDLIRLRQVLLNLCSNAVKFTKQGAVTLMVSFEQPAGELKFAIQDSGIGMSDEELERLFQPFVQADSSITRKFGGSGLGLVISQKLIQLMDGRLEVESIKGLGSRFDVIVPVGIATLNMVDKMPLDKKARSKPVDQLKHFAGSTVLVAEDNIDNQYLIELLLERVGVNVTMVDNGAKAVESAIAEDFDLILMDIQMPQMGGCDAVKLLRQSCIDCPIIALTANIMKEDIDDYLASGFDGTLAKPIQQQDFFQTLNHHLNAGAESKQAIDKLVSDLHNDDGVRQLKANFKAGLGDVVSEFRRLADSHDWPQLQAHAHKIKGSAGSLGYPALTSLAADIEAQVKAGQYEEAMMTTQSLIKTCDEQQPSSYEI